MWQDVCDDFTMVANACDFLCIWSMQASEFDYDNGTSGYLFYSYNILFCAVFALYFSLVIALHIQLQLKRGYEIALVCL